MGANMGKSGGGGNGSSLLENLTSTHPTLHIVMLGLDSAGKTTALYRLKFDQYVNTVRSLLSLSSFFPPSPSFLFSSPVSQCSLHRTRRHFDTAAESDDDYAAAAAAEIPLTCRLSERRVCSSFSFPLFSIRLD